jgi:hypothetical protein
MQEIVPLGFGFMLGTLLGSVTPRLRLPSGALLALALGVLSSVITGETSVSWAFVLIDIPIVSISAVLGLLAGRRISPLPRQGPG